METIDIAIPEAMRQYVEERVAQGGYSSVSEFVRDLIRADQKRNAEERVDALVLEGLDSGDAAVATSECWGEKKRNLTQRLASTTARNERP